MSQINKLNSYEIKIDDLVNYELTPNQYVLLNIIYSNNEVEYISYLDIDRQDILRHDLYVLYKKDYILNHSTTNYTFKFSELEITQKGIDVIDKKVVRAVKTNDDFDAFVNEYYNLWPEKIHSGNYLVKSGLKTCKEKMLRFVKEYKYDRDTIIKATKEYINICRKNNYCYMKTAYYFIKKDSESILQTYCEQVLSSPETIETDSNNKLYKEI